MQRIEWHIWSRLFCIVLMSLIISSALWKSIPTIPIVMLWKVRKPLSEKLKLYENLNLIWQLIELLKESEWCISNILCNAFFRDRMDFSIYDKDLDKWVNWALTKHRIICTIENSLAICNTILLFLVFWNILDLYNPKYYINHRNMYMSC